jgi:hypothetical protein
MPGISRYLREVAQAEARVQLEPFKCRATTTAVHAES